MRPSITLHFGKHLRAWRTHLGLSQTELSERSGVKQTTISLIESGKTKPHTATRRAFAIALGISEEDFNRMPSDGKDPVRRPLPEVLRELEEYYHDGDIELHDLLGHVHRWGKPDDKH